MIKKLVCLIILIFLFTCVKSIHAADDILKNISPSSEIEYFVRLNNGDVLSGYITAMVNNPTDGDGFKLRTDIGIAIIYANQIAEIIPKEELYRHDHRVFLMPTAEPIGSNFFISDLELLFFYGGFGISDIFSLTAGQTVVPGIPVKEQASVINTKFTVYQTSIDSIANKISLAVGINFGWLNNVNQIFHAYSVATIKLNKTSLSASVYYKLGAQDIYTANFANYQYPFALANGGFGLALGLDTRLPRRNDIHVIGELWNYDITRPTNTMVLLGLRISNTSMALDFGLIFITKPILAPFAGFAWTPF